MISTSGRRRGLRTRAAAAVLGCVAILAAACTTSTNGRPRGLPCDLSRQLVPSCGALWGVTTEEPTLHALEQTEHAVGRKFDIVYRFHDINDQIPDAAERTEVAEGRTLHVAIDSRDYGSNSRTTVSWADVAAGRFDSQLTGQARGIASLHAPVFVTFDHEPDQPRRAAVGTPAQFRSAWRHVHDLFSRVGATNAVWVWVVMGYQQTFARALTMWPGNRYVDWISWEAYNDSGCRSASVSTDKYVSFADRVLGFYNYVHKYGARFGIDVKKPMMISEAGSTVYPGAAKKTADWYAEIPSVLKKNPQIKAVGLWDHRGTGAMCDYRFEQNKTVLAAIARAGQIPFVHTRRK